MLNESKLKNYLIKYPYKLQEILRKSSSWFHFYKSNMKIIKDKLFRLTWLLILAFLILSGCSGPSSQYATILDIAGESKKHGVSTPMIYVVKAGDTLYKISCFTGIDLNILLSLNSIKDPNQIYVGQILSISENIKKPTKKVSSIFSESICENSKKMNPAIEHTAKRHHKNELKKTGYIEWVWPASGKVIQCFDKNNRGLDIEGSIGDSVIAAADGTVIYSGNGVRGLGNLVIINHKNSFITAYAHNSKLFVDHGQEIQRGKKIAEIGKSDSESPRLHFEIRKQGIPVDPIKYLPIHKIKQ